jgi:hypothetical protein
MALLREDKGEDAAEPYDVVAALPPGGDPAHYAAAGGHVVGPGLPGGCGIGGSGARGDPRRTIRPRRSDAICGLTRAAAPS